MDKFLDLFIAAGIRYLEQHPDVLESLIERLVNVALARLKP